MSKHLPAPLPDREYERWKAEAAKNRVRLTDAQLKHLFARYCRRLLAYYRSRPSVLRARRQRLRRTARRNQAGLVRPLFTGTTD